MNASDQIQPSSIVHRFCGACGQPLMSGAVVCAYCAKPVAAAQVPQAQQWAQIPQGAPDRRIPLAPPAVSERMPSRVADFVRATGRTRKAGYWIFGGGMATALSAFFPWVSLDGVDSTRPSGTGVVILLAIGGLLAYFGGRVLQGRITKRSSITLWILSAIDVLWVIVLFAALGNVNKQVGGGVQPSSGFLIGIAGLIAGVIGTVLVHTVRRKKEANALASDAGRSSASGA
jgi:hypothetical protein